ncbi:hypothetical protein CL652_01925 [bacterium]|nr:hypothetical protein [bacterium]|tara:strand:- start:11728 stop:12783 length:1056 start_codon:yes stop_codon:yes gene_type:complete
MTIPQQLLPYLKYAPVAALLFGLAFDIFTLDKPDALFENVVIIGYLTLSAVAMAALQSDIGKATEGRRIFLLSTLQFSFGNLASALMVLYARSGTFAGGAIFVGMLALLFLSNELLRDRYARTHLRVVIWFVLLLTYSTLIVPVYLGAMGLFAFAVSVFLALGVTLLLVFLLSIITYASFNEHAHKITTSIVITTTAFVGLYFLNLIPPVPLALKHVGIYHSVVAAEGSYSVTYEPPAWYEFWRDTNRVYTQQAGAPAFCFSSVYAPSALETEIRHRWEKYDEVQDEWITVARIPFPILGGREQGFRGYTQTSQIREGRWRCSVETSRGTLVGRTTFTVIQGIPSLEETSF